MTGLIGLIVWLAILGLIFYIINWALGQIPLPAPFPVIIRVILVLVCLVIALDIVAGIGGNFSYPGRFLR